MQIGEGASADPNPMRNQNEITNRTQHFQVKQPATHHHAMRCVEHKTTSICCQTSEDYPAQQQQSGSFSKTFQRQINESHIAETNLRKIKFPIFLFTEQQLWLRELITQTSNFSFISCQRGAFPIQSPRSCIAHL